MKDLTLYCPPHLVDGFLDAAKEGDIDKLNLFRCASVGVPVNVTDDEHKNALHWAVINDQPKCVEYLMKEGVDLNALDVYFCTALHYATYSCNLQCIETLVKYGIDVLQKDTHGNTALKVAQSIANNSNTNATAWMVNFLTQAEERQRLDGLINTDETANEMKF